MDRKDIKAALDSSLLPTGELDLAPITVNGTVNANLPLGSTASFTQGAGSWGSEGAPPPLVLILKSSIEFYEGQTAPDVSKNIVRAADQEHAICVNGRTAWNFKTAAGTTAVIKGKLLFAI